uniref:Uncharacterized protein n=1 Tax=Anopheles funestus TaxID=62324 RepID=A0A182RFW0_ANOFN
MVAVLVYNYAKHNFPQILKPCPVLGIFNVSGLTVDKNLIPPFVTPGGYFVSQRYHSKRNETYLHYELEFFVTAPSIFNKSQPYEISTLHYCQLETFRNGTQVAGIMVEALSNLHKVYATGGLYIQYFRSRTQLLASTMEYCQVVKNGLSMENAANKFALEYARQHFPQLLADCPIRPGKLFNITNVVVEDSLIPVFVIPGTYYVELRIYNKRNQTMFSGWLDADIK